MRKVVDRINTVLPLVPLAERSFRYRPLLPAVLNLISIDFVLAAVSGAAELKGILHSLLILIRDGEHSLGSHSELGDRLDLLTSRPTPPESLSWFAQSLHAYIYQVYSKARLLLIRRPQQRHLPASTQVVRELVVADYWLVEQERLHKVDEVIDAMMRFSSVLGSTVVQLAIRCCRVALELEASYEHAEDPGSFRQSLKHGRTFLQQYVDDLRGCYETIEAGSLSEKLRLSALENIVHASARLTAIEDDPLGYIADEPSAESRGALVIDAVQRYADELEHASNDGAEADGGGLVDRVSRLDALAYHYFKRACLEGPTVAFGATDRHRRHLGRATEHLRAAKSLLDSDSHLARTYHGRIVAMHWDLIERMTH